MALMPGGSGNDIYFVNDPADTIVEAVGGGIDTVYASIDYALAAGQEIENLRANAGLTGLALTGNEFANALVSGRGIDTLAGLGGNDRYYVNFALDKVVEAVGGGGDVVYTSVSYTLQAGQEIEVLFANAGSKALALTGNEFANALVSGLGIDTLAGLGGNDTYYVNDAGDKVVEAAGGGNDTVKASTSYALQAGQEVEILTANAGSVGLNLTGNEFANALVSGLGLDTLAGLGGDDTYYVNDAGDKVVEAAGGGSDTVKASASYALQAGQEIETLQASAGLVGLSLAGNQLANTLISGRGIDTLAGLGGNDTYYVNDAADKVVEAVGGGSDTVKASTSYALQAGQEVETLQAAAGLVGLSLTGNEIANTLISGRGIDTLAGLGGDDTYLVNYALDTVEEAVGGGYDTVYTEISYALQPGQEVEALYSNSGDGLVLTGNEFGNTLRGSFYPLHPNVLTGLGGNDRYYVNFALDKVLEAAGGGSDTVFASASWSMGAGQEIETLTANAGSTGLTLTGNELANTLISGAGMDTLIGLGGNDVYFVNNFADKVIEGHSKDQDTVYALSDWTLTSGQEIEFLRAGNAPAGITLTGDDHRATFVGRAPNGSGNHDTFVGLGGNDYYVLRNSADLVLESVGGGYDTIGTSVDYTLPDGQEIEDLEASSTNGLKLTGNSFDNALNGSTGEDTLTGGLGRDILSGCWYVNGTYGDTAEDQFVFNDVSESSTLAPDTIYWFTAPDKIDVHAIDADGNAGNGDTAFILDDFGDDSFATGHIRQTRQSSGDLNLDFNTDGDGESEMTIVIVGDFVTKYQAPLSNEDFIL